MPAQPTGTVTFLFTDLEGSTKLWERYPTAMRAALARHDALLNDAISANNGYVFKTIGDAFCAAFQDPADAVTAAAEAQRALASEAWGDTGPLRARMALHTGETEARDGDYFGQPVNRVARLLAVGHGQQVLLSDVTQHLVRAALPAACHLRPLGKHRLKDLNRPQPVYQLVSPEFPVSLKRLKSLPSPVAGGIGALGTSLLGIVSYRAQTRSSSEQLGLDLLSPLSLYTGSKGLIIELSTLNESLLLMVGLLLLTMTLAVGIARWRAIRRETGLHATETGRVVDWVVNQRTLAFLGFGFLIVLGAYGYQQYLWRVALPIPDGALGFAITREASAAAFQDHLADTLYTQGQSQRVVVRELPVKFDASDTAQARALGKRINAEAVIIYRVDESAQTGAPTYVAYIVFTDPNVGLVVGAAPNSASTGENSAAGEAPVQLKEGIGVPILRTETLSELVNAAAGIIDYNEHRLREAIKHLELALPQQTDGANTGIVRFYLGNARTLDGAYNAGANDLEAAADFYEGQSQTGERLGPQDALILVKTYMERGRIASLQGDWDLALTWYQKGLAQREDLVARADGLERPSDVHETYARLFSLMADAYRGLDKPEDQQFWQGRAEQELDVLVASADPNDPYPLIQESSARFFLGDCAAASEALSRALELEPQNVHALNNSGIVAFAQNRPDLAIRTWQDVLAVRPENVSAWTLIASQLVLKGVNVEYFDAGYLLEAENAHREVIRLDPTNVQAHEQIANLAVIRSQSAFIDTTALSIEDELTVQKSQSRWPSDPLRQEEALNALSVAIDFRRILASELDPGDALRQATVAATYAERQALYFTQLLNQPAPEAEAAQASPEAAAATPRPAGTPPPSFLEADPAIGQALLDDAEAIREWTDLVLANPDAPRLARLQAWAARVASFERVWVWNAFYTADQAKAAAAEQEYQTAVADAVAFGESAPITATDEITHLYNIYYAAMFSARFLDEDEVAASSYEVRIRDLSERESAERTTSTAHLLTICREAQEAAAADEALRNGNADLALQHYEAALAANPAYPPALLGAGRVLFEQDDLAGAIARAEAATFAAPDEPAAWADLGMYHLAAGNEDAGGQAYKRFLTLLADQRSQERMASLRNAFTDLQDLLSSRTDLASSIRLVLPDIAASLDAMADEGNRTYQYPALYTVLGELALRAGTPEAAEGWLRQALTLDSLQPLAHADLVVAVLAQGDDASAEIGAAAAMLRDPLWETAAEYPPDRVRMLMEDQAEAAAANFPDHPPSLESFLDALREATE
jgi:class 3 adenylate cyclase/predicted Zn-dependent protease